MQNSGRGNIGEFGKSKLIRQYFTPPNLPLRFLQTFVLGMMCLLVTIALLLHVVNYSSEVLIFMYSIIDVLQV